MITSPGMTETNILGSDTKLVEWLFTVTDANDVRYYWSFADISITSETGDLTIEESGTVNETGTQNDTGGNNQSATLAYSYKIMSCSPITLNRPTAENGVLAPSDVTFTISNQDNTLTWSDFIGGTVWIHISVGDFTHSFRPRINRFRIRDCKPGYQSLTFVCEDFIQQYLRGSYPNTRLIKDIFPSIDSDIDDDVCVPEPYGVAYVPLRSIYKAGAITVTSTVGAPTISFVASADGLYAQINDSGSGLGSFEADRFVTISGTNGNLNDGTFYIFKATASRLELHTASGIIAEAAGDSPTDIVLTQGSRYYVLGDTTNTYVIDKVHSPRESGKKSEWQDLDWTLSSSGISEYYAVSKHGGNPYLNEPKDAYGIARLTLNNIVATVGTLGGLAAGKWAYGDNEPGAGLGYDTVYVRTSGSADPDGLSANYVSVDTPFTQYTKADADAVDWRVFQPMIADANRDGIADCNGLWRPGDQFLDMPVKFSRSDTLTKTNPADVIKQVLLNLGVPLIDIDVATFTTAAAVFDAYTVPLEFNGAFWKKQERTKALSTLLNMCNSILISGEKIKLHVLSKTSKKEFFKSHNLTGSTYNWLASGSGTNEYYCVLAAGSADPSLPEPSACHIAGKSATRGVPGELSAGYWGYADNDTLGYSTIYVRLSDGSDPDTKLDDYIRLPADILKTKDQGPGTFKYSGIVSKYIDDAGYFAWQNVDEPQDNLNKKIMAIGVSATAISGSILELPFLNDSRDAQQAAKLSITRRLGKTANVSFDAKMSCILLQPGDVVSINHNDYGGSYDVLIDSVSIEKTAKTAKMRFVCSKFSQAFTDWDDSVPAAITVGSDDSINVWQPAESGPTTNQELARSSFQVWGSPYLYVGPTENQGQYTNIQEAVNALQESRHNGLYLLNGTYPRVIVDLPDRDIEIVGESQGGVILQNIPGSNLITIHNRTKTYAIGNLTIDSQNVAAYTNMIYVYGDTAADNTSIVHIDGVVFSLVDDGLWNGDGDCAVYADKGQEGSLSIGQECNIQGGFYGVYANDYDSVTIRGNNISDTVGIGIYVLNCPRAQIGGNRVVEFLSSGIRISGAASDNCVVSSNIVIIKDETATSLLDSAYGIHIGSVGTTGCVVNGNSITIDTAKSTIFGKAINIAGGNVVVGNNTIVIDIDSYDGIYGIAMSSVGDSVITNNEITLDNADDHFNRGFYFTGVDRTMVSSNTIDMVNSAAADVCVSLDSASDDNQVINNNFRRFGIRVLNSGSGNIVSDNTEAGVNMLNTDGQFAKRFMGAV